MSGASDALGRLRAATNRAHRDLEDSLGAVEKLRSVADRHLLIKRYHEMYAGADGALASWIEEVEGLKNLGRQRRDCIVEDLRNLGVAEAIVTAPRPGVQIHSRAEALGFLYVIEGSTLGGRLILRRLAAYGADTQGLSFLDPYGSRTGEIWRSFLTVLARELAGDRALLDQAASGAIKGFAYARACLCEIG